jgi:glycosyltransferase involved in cell wall biosynthesis
VTTPTSDRPAFAFVRWGSFSSANDRLLLAFVEMLPGYEVDVVDVFDLMGREGRLFRRLFRLYAWKEFGRVLLSGREPMWGAGGCFIRSTYYFDRVRRRLAERLAQRKYAFTLQTQSLFDGSVPGLPHFVYTDHAELQCLQLPGFSKKDLFPRRWIDLERSIYQHARIVFTMSRKTSTCLVEEYGCSPDRVAWVGAGQNAGHAGHDSGPDRYRRKRILFVGTKWELKGGPDLVAAFDRVLAAHPDAQLTIVGCSPAVEVPNCLVVGLVPIEHIGRYYDEASLFCVPSRREAYGFAFVEAMSHGLPVVATRVGALPEYVLDGENGYLVEVGDVEGLAARLTALLDDPEACGRLGGAARRWAESQTWESTARAMRRHIEAAIGPL